MNNSTDNLMQLVANGGIVVALFVLWWKDREMRQKRETQLDEVHVHLMETSQHLDVMAQLITNNTQALTKLATLLEERTRRE